MARNEKKGDDREGNRRELEISVASNRKKVGATIRIEKPQRLSGRSRPTFNRSNYDRGESKSQIFARKCKVAPNLILQPPFPRFNNRQVLTRSVKKIFFVDN